MVKNICYLNITVDVQTEVPIFAVYGGKAALPRMHKYMVMRVKQLLWNE